ncbi:hypothetical protein GLYMA_10G130002v4 [Glycine max]|nr:hypothetical protein GLYMA_10G130002v4 [Glycine max]KAH1138012.1 hypothetical protein GYH30_027851 [Glycine max]
MKVCFYFFLLAFPSLQLPPRRKDPLGHHQSFLCFLYR